MKKKLLLFPLLMIFIYVIATSHSAGPGLTGTNGTGSAGTTGCSCHGPSATPSITIALELDSAGIPVTHYIGGNSYTIKITGTNSAGVGTLPDFGFQVSAVLLAGAGTGSAVNAGTLPGIGLPVGTHTVTVAGLNLVEHSMRLAPSSGSGGAGTVYTESLPWTAPTTGTGTIKLYGVVNAVNADGGSSGDFWNTNSVSITELVVPTLVPITGTTTVCAGSNTTLSETTTGGTWSSGSPTVATVGATNGVVSGVAGGIAPITYTLGASIVTTTVTVTPLANAGTISGTSTVCPGANVSLTDAAGGGTWSSGSTGIATVSASGVVTGILPGASVITYSVTNVCGSATATFTITVNSLPSAGIISGTATLCATTTETLTTTATGGGLWSSVHTGIASVISTSGVVTGVGAGFDSITFTASNACGSASASFTIAVSPAPNAGVISGPASVCQGALDTLSESVSGGTWSSGSPTVATVSSTGVVSGSAPGSAVIVYSVSNSCGSATATQTVTVNTLPFAGVISGTHTLCTTATATLTTTGTAGVWNSAHSGIATIDSSTGFVTGMSSGLDTIIFSATNACAIATAMFTLAVSPAPNAGVISGPTSVCAGSSITLGDTATSGTWSSSSIGIATVSSGGVVAGLSPGMTVIVYSVTNSCGTAMASQSVTVNSLPTAGTVTGTSTVVCAGGTLTLTSTASGGTWSSSAAGIASVSVAGVVTGVASGSASILYTVANACATITATYSLTVNPALSLHAISGSSTVCAGSTVTLTDSTSGGTWASGSSGIATVSPTGTVHGLTTGVAVIMYSVSTACGSASVSHTVTVMPLPYAGTITGSTSVCAGSVITLTDTATGGIWVSDSPAVATITSGGVLTGVASGTDVISYTVTNSCGSSRATYTVSAFASPTVAAITGSSTVTLSGTTTLSDAVIGGSWSSSNTLIATINSFGQVTGVDTGMVTITYTVFNILGCSHDTTFTFTVVPPLGIAAISNAGNSFMVYPNPVEASNDLHIAWQNKATGNAEIVITDLTGREVKRENITIQAASGSGKVNLQGIANGMYIISITTTEGIFNSAIEVRK